MTCAPAQHKNSMVIPLGAIALTFCVEAFHGRA
jgi:hypothetical protein